MTSREATGLLPRAHDADARVRWRRSVADWATLLAFGPINAPWLLRSLHGGSKAGKRALLDRLGLPHDALPNLGSWKADVGLLTMVADHVLAERPRVVVEFGAGASTLIVARALELGGGGTHIAFDQHADFIQATGHWLAEYGLGADLRRAPLMPAPGGWPGLWYDHGPLPDAIDFMLVDGPPWTVHPFTRAAAATLFGRIAPGGTVMLDDGARPGERVIARRWRRRWPDFDFELVKSGTKGTLVGTRRR
ncbi:MAG TPA: class I SAM-dependent methyltransferase [Allosphingosinicella sp.]|nr:class I SAM-dependent methyltransferase [Allosphingosinicella sp.]